MRRLVAVIALATACRGGEVEPPEDFVYEGRPVSEWVAASANIDNMAGQRQAWVMLRRLGPRAVPPIRRAMEEATDPERRSRIGLAFGFLCVDALPAIRQAQREARDDVQLQLQFAGDLIAESDSLRRSGDTTAPQGGGMIGPCRRAR